MAQTCSSRRLHLLVNPRSGRGEGKTLGELAGHVCQALGVSLVGYPIDRPAELVDSAHAAARIARQSGNDVIVVAGGDGTIRTVAEILAGTSISFAVVPLGTFNYFARAHGIPLDAEAALRLAITGAPEPVRLGEINGRIFLVNASLGLYARSVQEREITTRRFGRKRVVVILSTIATLLKRHRLLHVSLRSNDVEWKIRTPLIFIGNNAEQLRNLSLGVADCFRRDLLAVVALKPVRGREMLRVIVRGITRTLEKEERLQRFCTEHLRIETKRQRQMVALDGEMFDMRSPFVIRSLADAIALVKPDAPAPLEPA